MGLTARIGASFEDRDGDASICPLCNEQIFGPMKALVVHVGPISEEVNYNVCLPCYEMHNIKPGSGDEE